jgi:hypothetical protein
MKKGLVVKHAQIKPHSKLYPSNIRSILDCRIDVLDHSDA